MGITDAALLELDATGRIEASRATTPKARAAARLNALRQAFEHQHIPAESLVFGGIHAKRSLRRHVLLAETSMCDLDLDDVFIALSGGGVYYGGMFGTPEELRAGTGAMPSVAAGECSFAPTSRRARSASG